MKPVTMLGGTAVATMLLTIGCGGTSSPTHPSPSSSAAASGVTGPAQAMPVVTSWSCLTQSAAGTAGIFAGGVRDAACPAQPRGLVVGGALAAPGTPPSLTSSINGSTVTLTWLVPTSPDPATSYVIEAGSSAGSTNIAVLDTLTAATSFTVTGVPSGTYFVRVRARNSAGTSAASNEVVVIVAGGPCAGAPNAPSGLTSSVSGSSVSLSWTGPASGCAPTGYVIEAGSTPGSSNLANFNTGSTAPAFSAGGVPAGPYYVRVRAANGSGAGGPSNEVLVIVGTSVSVAGRWVGVAPDGMIIEDAPGACTLEADLQLDLTQSGTAVTGTATLNERRVAPGCRGGVSTSSLLNVTVGSGTISFSIPAGGSQTIDFSGTFTATRMIGTLVTFGGRRGTFAVNRQ